MYWQLLEGWKPQEYGHYLDQVEAALTAAVQDALGETRTNGRTAFAAYANALPDRAAALLKRFDSGLQQKLHEAVVAYGKGHAGRSEGPSTKRQLVCLRAVLQESSGLSCKVLVCST